MPFGDPGSERRVVELADVQAEHLLLRIPQARVCRTVDVDEVAVKVNDEDPVRRQIKQVPVFGLALPDPVLGLFALGDVLERTERRVAFPSGPSPHDLGPDTTASHRPPGWRAVPAHKAHPRLLRSQRRG